ncbi:hypothetical protein BJX66DRAFT_60461 [Aspergillus keveii]|uniref:C2H2-type domain-containing protein n=1 Tax=Aspergillus keveii TaxID=714993 RepID=A0ABR4FQ86_9EURO
MFQEVPVLWNPKAELHQGFALGPDDTHDPSTWSNTLGATQTRQNQSGLVLAQSTAGATSISYIPSPSTAQDNHVPTQGGSVYYYTDLHGQLQDHARLSRSPPSLISSIENAPPANRTFQCKWLGCRSVTIFCRESELIRHLKTVHISPKAYPCTEPMCGMAFGRRDHLRAHQRNRHGG